VSANRSEGVMPKRKRSALAPNAHLDDLLRFEDAAPPLPGTQRPRPWLVRSALQAFIASAVIYTAFHAFNLAPPYLLILAVCGGAVLVRRAVAMTAEPAWQRTRDVVRPPGPTRRIEPGGWFADADGMLQAVRRWDRRLDWGATAAERFGFTVAGRLGELADERLRQRHSMTRATDPVRARRLLGDDVWILVHGPMGRVPTPSEISAVVDRLDSL